MFLVEKIDGLMMNIKRHFIWEKGRRRYDTNRGRRMSWTEPPNSAPQLRFDFRCFLGGENRRGGGGESITPNLERFEIFSICGPSRRRKASGPTGGPPDTSWHAREPGSGEASLSDWNTAFSCAAGSRRRGPPLFWGAPGYAAARLARSPKSGQEDGLASHITRGGEASS